jgi:hypothetical protein
MAAKKKKVVATGRAAALEALGYSEGEAKRLAGKPDFEALAARGMALRMLWDLVIDEEKVAGEPRWIEQWMRWPRSQKKAPEGLAAILQRVLDRGVDPDDLTQIVRTMQYGMLFNLCQVLDGEAVEELRERIPGLPELSFRLYRVSEDDDATHPVAPIESLHESIGSFDPAGRDGAPRG